MPLGVIVWGLKNAVLLQLMLLLPSSAYAFKVYESVVYTRDIGHLDESSAT